MSIIYGRTYTGTLDLVNSNESTSTLLSAIENEFAKQEEQNWTVQSNSPINSLLIKGKNGVDNVLSIIPGKGIWFSMLKKSENNSTEFENLETKAALKNWLNKNSVGVLPSEVPINSLAYARFGILSSDPSEILSGTKKALDCYDASSSHAVKERPYVTNHELKIRDIVSPISFVQPKEFTGCIQMPVFRINYSCFGFIVLRTIIKDSGFALHFHMCRPKNEDDITKDSLRKGIGFSLICDQSQYSETIPAVSAFIVNQPPVSRNAKSTSSKRNTNIQPFHIAYCGGLSGSKEYSAYTTKICTIHTAREWSSYQTKMQFDRSGSVNIKTVPIKFAYGDNSFSNDIEIDKELLTHALITVSDNQYMSKSNNSIDVIRTSDSGAKWVWLGNESIARIE